MKRIKEFPFDKARRVTAAEVRKARMAIGDVLGKKRKRRGRPSKSISERYCAVSIRLHPKVLIWARNQAKKQHVGYQTIINEVLLKRAA